MKFSFKKCKFNLAGRPDQLLKLFRIFWSLQKLIQHSFLVILLNYRTAIYRIDKKRYLTAADNASIDNDNDDDEDNEENHDNDDNGDGEQW